MFRKIVTLIRHIFGSLPVSYKLESDQILVHRGNLIRKLVRLSDIQSWCTTDANVRAVTIRLRNINRSIIVGDQSGQLGELLTQVAPDKKVRR